MTQFLPPNLLALFAPRDPIPFLPPIEKHANHRKLPYTGVAQFLGEFEDASETPAPVRIETREERKERKRREKQEQANYKLEQDLALWNPKKNPKATSNPYNTMFVARLNYETTESKLKREIDVFGRINNIVMVKNVMTGKPRGYCFVEFEHERDMHAAVKSLNGRKIDGVRVVTDVERGRTRPDWRPRRLGKGLGKNRQGPSDKSHRKHENGRDPSHDRSFGRPISSAHVRDRDKEYRRRRSRSRSKSKERDRRGRSRSRDRHRKRRSPDERERDRDHKRRDRRRDDMIQQYGEYGAEIRAEYNGDA
ncbi:putative u1 small nuclear ribonucleoprotein 70 kD [Schistosoma mansoni]|uniref:U1 small nuclear ribonucleoprotein 70 kDa n=1 Tax=Schistosoma mansoni TaxID=6183 RepID=G4VEH2_SCHMA|nr:putative u1 small nuclear ribonucleoprotein 70 kD [Schistosoma mansoni]|eukprot:XP_018650942.1 putative u1 small nuclear ribonucleoprotein 70 kD [Schistosoma mansoni]